MLIFNLFITRYTRGNYTLVIHYKYHDIDIPASMITNIIVDANVT